MDKGAQIMVLNYQRWTALCGCSFEQEVNSDTGEVKLLFAHAVCGGHEDIAKNTPQPKTISKIKDDIIKAKHDAWKRNKEKNESDFDNHEQFKKIKQKVNAVGPQNLATTDPNLQATYEYFLEERRKHLVNVDRFTNDRSMEMMFGLESPYALNAHEVYKHIVEHPEEQEQQVASE